MGGGDKVKESCRENCDDAEIYTYKRGGLAQPSPRGELDTGGSLARYRKVEAKLNSHDFIV